MLRILLLICSFCLLISNTTLWAQETSQTRPPEQHIAEWSYPIGIEGQALGDGFLVRHGYASENTWYNPGWWHTAEDWYALEGDTAGARVYAIAVGEVVYANANYPGRVVIIRHADGIYSMYGHLDPALAVRVGDQVERGSLLGTVLKRSDTVPNHLHFEIRSFLTTRAVNGAAPRYGYRCGRNCPPGPGYWPMRDRQHPSELGWRNPTHAISQRAFADSEGKDLGHLIAASQPLSQTVTLWSTPPDGTSAQRSLGTLRLRANQRLPLQAVWHGDEASLATSAEGYQLWYKVGLANGRSAWIQAAVPDSRDTGSDGRPSSVRFVLFPALLAE